MSPEEIRAKALTEAVTLGIHWSMESVGDILALATRMEAFIIGQPAPELVRRKAVAIVGVVTEADLVDPEPHDVGHAEDIWGAPCARPGCGHSQGLHGPTGCHYPPDSTHPDFCECDAFAAPGSCTCAHPLTGPEHFGGLGCTSVFDGVRCECRYDGGNR